MAGVTRTVSKRNDPKPGLPNVLAAVESERDSDPGSALLAANEELLVSMLRIQADADASRQAFESLAQSVGLDTLTQLPNRSLFLDRFAQAIASAKVHERRMALLFVDLDNFKQVNDQLGHSAGDQMLRRAALCLSSAVRDMDTVSRHGGDEFLILLSEVVDAADAERMARDVIETLGLELMDGRAQLTASVGISIYPDHGDDPLALIENADVAMYAAKRRGPGGTAFFRQDTWPPALNAPGRGNEEHEPYVVVADELVEIANLARCRQADFLTMLARELRMPLKPVPRAIDAPSDLCATNLPLLKAAIERQIEHINRLLVDALEVSRTGTERLQITREDLDVASVIRQAVDTCRPTLDRRAQQVRWHPLPAPIAIRGDAACLGRLFVNLLDNASRLAPEGGRIELSLTSTGRTAVVTIADDGPGMEADVLSGVPDPFIPDTDSMTCPDEGHGIGLAVAREMVDAHGGKIISTKPVIGMGSELIVVLPLCRTFSSDNGDGAHERTGSRHPGARNVDFLQ